MKPIGFVGLGIMGKGMIKNLLTKIGAPMVVWNRGVPASEEIAGLFPDKVAIAQTPAEVIQRCDVTFTMLSTLEASAAVYDAEPDGVIAGVSEGKGPAEAGTLVFLCGGSEDVFNHPTVSAGLDAMGKAKFLHGPVGQGSRMKLVVNMVMGTMMGAFVEGMKLAESIDISQEQLLAVLDLGAMANPMFKLKGPKIIAQEFEPHFPLKHAQKDMRLALELASQSGLQLPTSSSANDLYVSVLDTKGDEDFAAVHTALSKK